MELSNRFQALHLTDVSVHITERYKSFETTEREVTGKVVGEREPCGLPSWVSDKTIHLKKREIRSRSNLLNPRHYNQEKDAGN